MTEPETAEIQPNPSYSDAMDVIFNQAMYFLTPFFMDGANGDPAKARAGAQQMLLSYQSGSFVETQLTIECIQFAYSAMESLRQAKVDEMPDSRRLRLRTR